MAKAKLKTEQNTTEMQAQVEELFDLDDDTQDHENLSAHFDHGQWWVTCGACGASWSVVDVNDWIGLERIDQGDESCPT